MNSNEQKVQNTGAVSDSTFTNEELQIIKIDILHIYDNISLNEIEVHKRNLILNKLKILLDDKGVYK